MTDQPNADPLAQIVSKLDALAQALIPRDAATTTPPQPQPAAPAPAVGAGVGSQVAGAIAAIANTGLLARIWRPVAMFAWIGTWPFQLLMIFQTLSSTDPKVQATLNSIAAVIAAFNAAPATLATFYSVGRTKEKVAAANAIAGLG